jgi:Rad3-related DNA helicase
VVEAPTGLGKTAAVWAAVRTYALERKLKVLWLTRTALQVRQSSLRDGDNPRLWTEASMPPRGNQQGGPEEVQPSL